jgi:hypothetical protein
MYEVYNEKADARLVQVYEEHHCDGSDANKKAILYFLMGKTSFTIEDDAKPLTEVEMDFLRKEKLL